MDSICGVRVCLNAHQTERQNELNVVLNVRGQWHNKPLLSLYALQSAHNVLWRQLAGDGRAEKSG